MQLLKRLAVLLGSLGELGLHGLGLCGRIHCQTFLKERGSLVHFTAGAYKRFVHCRHGFRRSQGGNFLKRVVQAVDQAGQLFVIVLSGRVKLLESGRFVLNAGHQLGDLGGVRILSHSLAGRGGGFRGDGVRSGGFRGSRGGRVGGFGSGRRGSGRRGGIRGGLVAAAGSEGKGHQAGKKGNSYCFCKLIHSVSDSSQIC